VAAGLPVSNDEFVTVTDDKVGTIKDDNVEKIQTNTYMWQLDYQFQMMNLPLLLVMMSMLFTIITL